MPEFQATIRGLFYIDGTTLSLFDGPTWIAFPNRGTPPADLPALYGPTPPADASSLTVDLNSTEFTLTIKVHHNTPLQYFRLADGAVKPLPADPPPLNFSPGDTYIALNLVALDLADSPAIARFLHLRDYFNAEKLADALLAHLIELAGLDEPPPDLSLLIVECR